MHNHSVFLFSQEALNHGFTILSLGAIVIFLLLGKTKAISKRYLIAYFCFAIVFHLGDLLAKSFTIPIGHHGYKGNAIAAFGMVAFIQFAYHFPQKNFARESLVAFYLSTAVAISGIIEYFYFSSKAVIVQTELAYGPVYSAMILPLFFTSCFFWIVIVFFRQALNTVNNPAENRLRAIFRPTNRESRVARNFALMVFLEVLNTGSFALYNYFRLISYEVISFSVPFTNLFIYACYFLIFIYHSDRSLPTIFKLVGVPLTTLFIAAFLFANLSINNSRRAYDDSKVNKILALGDAIEDRASEFENIEYVLEYNSNGVVRVLYKKKKVPKLEPSMRLWPGLVSFKEIHGTLNSNHHTLPNASLNRRYFTRFSDENFYQFHVQIKKKRLAVGFDYFEWRNIVHEQAFNILIVTVVLILVVSVFLPYVYFTILLSPLRKIQSDVHSALKKANLPAQPESANELEHLSDSIDWLINAARRASIEQDDAVNQSSRQKVAQTISYLEANFDKEIDRETLATQVDLSTSRLGRAFKSITGMKLGDYINSLRVRKAMKSLKNTDATILEVAYSVGFESLRTFNRAFQRLNGISPSQYRERLQNQPE